jgi:hypothetical protein
MKFRHATALALVGWYLMVQPATRSGVRVSDSPRHHYPGWTMKAGFTSQSDCDKAQRALVGQAMPHSLDLPADQAARDDNQKKFKARCVPEDTLQRWKKLEGR